MFVVHVYAIKDHGWQCLQLPCGCGDIPLHFVHDVDILLFLLLLLETIGLIALEIRGGPLCAHLLKDFHPLGFIEPENLDN